ncbi:MAG: carbohydrate-binding protein [Bacteroidales bacterium]
MADFDQSILLINLNQNIQENENVTLSYQGEGILSGELVLDSLDRFYVHNSVGSMGEYSEIPGRIEAEDYIDMYGIQTETCTDVGGGLNVGYIDSGDWMKYNIEVKSSGIYQIIARMAGYGNGTLNLKFEEDKEAYISFASTDGWQNWADFDSEVYLEEGRYTMEAIARTDAININYFDFSLTSSITNLVFSIDNINVYPNPNYGELNISFISAEHQDVSIKLIDITGRTNDVLYQGDLLPGINNYKFNLDSNLPTGIYFIEIKDELRRYFKKVIIK